MSELTFLDRMSVELLDVAGDDERIARAAWVSTSAAEKEPITEQRISGLIRALLRDKHGSPFEHGMLTFRCHVTLNVRSEHHRHRVGWSYNEQSGRYTPYEPVFYCPPPSRPMVKPSEGFRQIRPKYEPVSIGYHAALKADFEIDCLRAWDSYQTMLADGIAGEVARMILPGCLFTTYWATCNPRSLMHFLALRTHEPTANHPSYPMVEMEQVAREMEDHFAEHFPLTYAAFVKYGRECP